MEYREFYDKLKEGSLPGLLLLHGEEEYVKRNALEALRSATLPEGLEVMNEAVFDGTADETALIEALETLPFMAERRLVIVRDHPLTGSGPGGDGARLIEYLPRMPEYATLAFYARGNADMRRKVPSAIQKAGGAVIFRPLDDRELNAFLARECQRRGKKIAAAAVERLVFLCGRDLTVLTLELDKIAAHAGERGSIGVADVEAVATPNLEANVFRMADALFDGKAAAAESLRRALLREGESPIMILAVLTRNLRQLHHAKLVLDAGLPRAEAEKAAGVSGYAASRVLNRASKMDAKALEKAKNACAQADYDIKSGVRSEDAALGIAAHTISMLFGR